MRKIRFQSRAVAVLAAALLPLLAAAGVITYTATYDNSKLTLGTDTLGGVTYTTVHYDGLYNGGEAGTPSLPIDHIRFSVPYNATNFSVSTTVRMPVNNNISHLVYPNQAPRLMNDTTPVVINLPDTAAYYSGTTYPSVRAWVADEGFLAGENHIVTVAVMPVAYSHTSTSDMLILSRTVNLTLNYSINDSTTFKPLVRNDSVLRQEGFQLAQSMVVNPNQVIAYAPAGPIAVEPLDGNLNLGGYEVNGHGHVGDDPVIPPIDPPQPVDTTWIYTDSLGMGLNYPYLIITTNELLNSMRRLVALKRQKGYKVKIVTLDSIMSDPQAHSGDIIKKNDGTTYIAYSDPAGVIRQYLKKAFKYWGTKYALLAGDIAYREITLKLNQRQNKFITLSSDLYYCDLTADWSTGQIDYQPELYVGRIIAKNKDQINNYSDKLFRYELNPGNGNGNYLDRILYSMGFECLNGAELSNARYFFDQIFTESKVLRESQNIYDTSKFPSGKDIIDSINARQYGFISLNHHGFPGGLVTYGLRDYTFADDLRFLWAIDSVHVFADSPSHVNDDPLTGNGLNNMDNKYYPSICYSTACSTIPFTALPGYESLPMNFGESFTTGNDYGGPAFIGNTQTSYTPSTGELEMIFGGRLYNGYYNIGIANGLAKSMNYFISDTVARKYVPVAQNLLGDPSLEIWTDIPQHFEGVTITRKDNSISISGLNGDEPTFVSFVDNIYAPVLYKSSSGLTLNKVSPNSVIMLYKHNYIPYIAPLVLQNTTLSKSQYVIADDVIAGYSVDSNRTYGTVTVKSGVNYEIETSGTVTLAGGFTVEKGAFFTVSKACFKQ